MTVPVRHRVIGPETLPPSGCTLDAIDGGRLVVAQPGRGFRFTVDSLLLADFALQHDVRRVLDVGAGCGVISLSLAVRKPDATVHAIERQPALAACLEWNVRANGLERRVVTLEADIRDEGAVPTTIRFTQVVMNPPYFSATRGRLSPDPQRAAARHQLHGSLADLVRASARHLDPGGSLSLIYPARQQAEAFEVLTSQGLGALSMTLVHPNADSEACFLLVNASFAGTLRVTTLPPMYLEQLPADGSAPSIVQRVPGTLDRRNSP